MTQDIRRYITACFVAIENGTERVAGFYSLSACHIALNDLPEELLRKLPRYGAIPAVRVGRLAVDEAFKGSRKNKYLNLGRRDARLARRGNAVIFSIFQVFATPPDGMDRRSKTGSYFFASPKGQGLGGALLIDAARRSLRSDIAAFAMVVDAKDERAADFYRHFGFLDLERGRRTLFISLGKLAKRLE